MDEAFDPAILAALPEGCEVISTNPHGKGSWSTGYQIDIEVDGIEKEYFLKIIRRVDHEEMARGEFESQMELYKFLPHNVIIPIAYGRLAQDSGASFYLTPFQVMSESKTPSPAQLVEVLENLHMNSKSPTGKFGFHVKTFNGFVPIVSGWYDSWEEWFTKQLRADIEWEKTIRGTDLAFDATYGRSIKPSLCHGDLWHGNAQIDLTTQRVILFDSCCCYAHNEFDLGMMREPRYLFTGQHAERYREVVRPSEPAADFDDRNALYAMHDNIINSGLHEHRAFLREQVRLDMEKLIAKHPQGLDGFYHEL
ncbi:Fructosamine kinase-domain-containing protein [Xylariaceae sp. FL1272]|nr:Fructosamine kinase-domain-containing protein [Xylariaceae sp. FL1272]